MYTHVLSDGLGINFNRPGQKHDYKYCFVNSHAHKTFNNGAKFLTQTKLHCSVSLRTCNYTSLKHSL